MAKFIEDSKNSKISGLIHKVAATYASIEKSCPDSCELKGGACYAQTSFVGMHVRKLDKSAIKKKMSATDVSLKEAKLIRASFKGKAIPQDGAKGGRDLRLHVAGDCLSRKGASALAKAAEDYRKRGGGNVWSYTHNWSKIERGAFGKHMSILASVDKIEDIKKAHDQGYAAAIVVEKHQSDKAYEVDGHKLIPCPEQTHEVPCAKCRLCMNDSMLFAQKATIAFAIHSAKKGKFKLNVVSQ